ncbi:hypothetical protein [Acinetobacter gerneri]|uniref:Uncharacterized protein n=2 Tax=Acinetobacter gerneri TaxID=202952 RepID=N8ZSR4_9GAMM|nr:hypothetical protein [Acinetobacter gerneri]ENV34510.1 hypothetical protein F960_01248 [Acinetobacter gerneri DSM 14967 = CIP 107464 = MTCC 9824]EPR82936.1 hypothetical protein L289_2661 [Acinetobacter gerneri DSM 14967 = CIP 107464 = MTCC 9824]MDQ9008996.1 hypothetical protein [Acinetobacter gerneri]MDQ9013100.1 hypothetical protein [Acinetobacter gerneri]MDQ9024537.1 hypothetical protein [Acinetobacter gerneri]
MDIKNTAITATMVIQSLVKLLENENVDISSVKFKVGFESEGYESPEFKLEKLIDLAYEGLEKIKEHAIPEGFVLVEKEIPDCVVDRLENSSYHWGESTRDYFAPIYRMMIEAQEQGHD